MTITDVVPDCDDGSQVSDYQTAFTVIQCPVINASATIFPGEDPLLIEASGNEDDKREKEYDGSAPHITF